MDYILNALAMAVELTNIILCYTQILQKELCDRKRRIAIAYVGAVLCSGVYTFYSGESWSVFIRLTIPCIAASFTINWNKVKTIMLSPCAYMLESAVCAMCSYIVAMVLDVSQISLIQNKVASIFINSIFSILIGMKYLIDIRKNVRSTKLAFSKLVYMAIIIGAISFLFILGAVQAIGEDYKVPYNQTNFLGFLLSSMCMIFFFLFIWLSTTIYKKNAFQKEKDMMNLQMVEQERYIKLVVEKDMDMRKFRHDVKEHMRLVHKYLEDSEYDEAKEYIRKMYEVFSESQIIRYTGINAVDAIISEKKRCMDEKGIVLNWKASVCEFPMRLEIFDMCTMFTNIITNAIESCEKLETGDRYIDMSISIYEDNVHISESNKTRSVMGFDEFGDPISTKEHKREHGYGCKNIRGVVEKYGGELKYTIEDEIFSIDIIL